MLCKFTNWYQTGFPVPIWRAQPHMKDYASIFWDSPPLCIKQHAVTHHFITTIASVCWLGLVGPGNISNIDLKFLAIFEKSKIAALVSSRHLTGFHISASQWIGQNFCVRFDHITEQFKMLTYIHNHVQIYIAICEFIYA